MTFKALFLDLDGTSLNDHNRLSPALQAILTKLREDGLQVIFSTGRSFAGALPFANAIGGIDYMINYNGARVFDFRKDRVLYEALLPRPVLEQVFEFSKIHQYPPIFYHNNVIYTADGSAHHHTCPGERFAILDPDYNWLDEDITKALFVVPSEQLTTYLDFAHQHFQSASISTSSATYLEVMPQGVNKSVGVQHVLEQLNIDPKHCIAFGDQRNDLEMLSLVGHPYVMGNAIDPLKVQFPDRVVQTNLEDGVARTLDHLFKLNYF